MAERREGTEALPWRNRSNNAWSKDTFHRRSYDCARRVAKYDRGFPNTNFAILATVFPAHPADAEMTRTYGYSGITGTLAQAGDPFATVSFAWLDEFPHLGGDQAAWTLVDELQAAIPEGWYVVLSAAPRGSKGAPLDVFVGRKQGGGLQMTSVGKAPQ